MDVNALIKKFVNENNLDVPTEENGVYEFVLDGNAVYCSGTNRQLLLESTPGELQGNEKDQNVINELLLSRSLGFIREHRVCLSINEETGKYCLHQRLSMEDLTTQTFREALEKFGGCHRYVTELIQKALAEKA